MMVFVIVTIVVFLVGLSGATFVFPLLAATKRPQVDWLPISTPTSFDILIPAHDEEQMLPATLASVQHAVAALKREFPACATRILVGADRCTDATVELAREAGAEVAVFDFASKWLSLKALTALSTAELVAWVDAGALWPEDFALRIFCEWRPGMIGLAPAYGPRKAGLVGRAIWATERTLKSFENRAGGPISVHGATVVYEAKALGRALEALGVGPWLNDDFAVPYVLRSQNPAAMLRYLPKDRIDDAGFGKATAIEGNRRLRMARGNVDVFRFAFAHEAPRAPELLLGRRFFRLIWAWWAWPLSLPLILAGFVFRKPAWRAAPYASFVVPLMLLSRMKGPTKWN